MSMAAEQARAWARVYEMDDFQRSENAEKLGHYRAALDSLEEAIDHLIKMDEAEEIRLDLYPAITRIEFAISRLEV